MAEALAKKEQIEKKYKMKGIACSSCAAKIEREVNDLPQVENAELNFANGMIKIEADREEIYRVESEIREIADRIEPGLTIVEDSPQPVSKVKYIFKGLNCSNCAAKIRKAISNLPQVEKAELNFATSKMTVIGNPEVEHMEDELQEIADRIENGITVKKDKKEVGMTEQDRTAEGNTREKGETESAHPYLWRFASGAFLFGLALILYELPLIQREFPFWLELTLYGTAYVLVGSQVVLAAFRNIKHGDIFDENFLMTIATFGAFAIQEYPEAVAVMLFYMIGEMFQDRAVNKSRKSIKQLMDIRPDFANLKRDGKIEQVDPEAVDIGDIILVKPGEKVPLDGEVIEGSSRLDTSALTGESVPRKVETGDEILSGMINQDGLLTIKVTKLYRESTVSRILDLVENASAKKAPTEKFVTKFARYYTPVVVYTALAMAIIPPLFLPGAVFSDWIYRALIFLVVSCPCALVVSIPLGFFGGIGKASRKGILVKGGNYLEALNQVDKIVFDKTGTLTEGVFEVNKIRTTDGYTNDELLEVAAHGEAFSNHPIAQSIREAYDGEINKEIVEACKEVSGHGVDVIVRGRDVLIGNHKLMAENDINYEKIETEGTIVHLAIDGNYAGYITITDLIKDDSESAIRELKEKGISNVSMLTGDREYVAKKVADKLKLDDYYAELLPDEKVEKVEELLHNKNKDDKLAFVGDGINDAPVLARSDIGVAMGGLGSDAAIEAADVVLMTDEPSKLASAIDIARRTRKIVWQNIIMALGVKGIVLVMGAFGVATMWEAVFADVGVALLAVLNAMRIIRSE